jgi:diaminopimelate decarboxylase
MEEALINQAVELQLSDLTEKFSAIQTPFYYYDLDILKQTLEEVKLYSEKYNFQVHYAVKANTEDRILRLINSYGIGADCVSGNEVKKAIETGFPANKVVFAGVGKSDKEIIDALNENIFCFNCESIPELEIINSIAEKLGKIAPVALRINPNVNANTHKYITTGLEENKFGINTWELESVLDLIKISKNISLKGIHFHIGSQISDLATFKSLCLKINEIQKWFEDHKITLNHINAGGGLGINYQQPDENLVPDFKNYFELFQKFLELRPHQQLHFELGRSLVGQCGSLISRVLYIKKGINTNFAILDAGMTDLIRPALYQAYHKIENLSAAKEGREVNAFKYDIVGPVCESSDCFGKAVQMQETFRNDLIVIRSAGAYGQVMASDYNLRERAKAVFSVEL